MKKRVLKSRNPIAKQVTKIRPQVIPDKRRKKASELWGDDWAKEQVTEAEERGKDDLSK